MTACQLGPTAPIHSGEAPLHELAMRLLEAVLRPLAAHPRNELVDALRERHLGLPAPQHRFARQRYSLSRDSTGRSRSRGPLRMLRGLHVDQIACSGTLRRCNSAYFGRAVVDFTANQPGLSLFHCHIQQHMDYGFKALFRYA